MNTSVGTKTFFQTMILFGKGYLGENHIMGIEIKTKTKKNIFKIVHKTPSRTQTF
jgi:hypothetical protein